MEEEGKEGRRKERRQGDRSLEYGGREFWEGEHLREEIKVGEWRAAAPFGSTKRLLVATSCGSTVGYFICFWAVDSVPQHKKLVQKHSRKVSITPMHLNNPSH